MTQHTLSLGPLSLLATQTGPLLNVTIHAPSDTAPVGKMTLTVPEWASLVALVDCMGAADKRHAEDRAEIERLSISVDRYQDAAWAGIEESSDNVECCAVDCSIVCASMNARASGWTINRNGLPFCFEHADRALNPTETKSDRDSLRQQVRDLTAEHVRDTLMVAALRARLAKAETQVQNNPATDGCVTCEIDHRRVLLDQLITDRDRLRSDLSAALVSVDAMAERIEQMRPVYERAVEWRERSYPNARSWIVQPRDAALVSAIDTALARTAGEQAKEKDNG